MLFDQQSCVHLKIKSVSLFVLRTMTDINLFGGGVRRT